MRYATAAKVPHDGHHKPHERDAAEGCHTGENHPAHGKKERYDYREKMSAGVLDVVLRDERIFELMWRTT
jgi:hypothetical protein